MFCHSVFLQKAVDSSSQSVLSSDHVALLGHLIEFLDDDTLNSIDRDAVKDSFPEWGSFSDADEHAVEKFALLVKKHLTCEFFSLPSLQESKRCSLYLGWTP